MDTGKHAKKRFNKVVQQALIAAIGRWHGDLPAICHNPSFLTTVTEQLQADLFDIGFFLKLNGNATRRYFAYGDGWVEGRDTHDFLRMSPEITTPLNSGYACPTARAQELNSKLSESGLDATAILQGVKVEEEIAATSCGNSTVLATDFE